MNFDNYLNILKSGIYRQRVKVELLHHEDESVISEISNYLDSTNGSISISYSNGIRRTCSFEINNTPDNPYYIHPDSLYLNSMFKISTGLEDENGNIEWFSQGIYCIDNPSITSEFSNSKIQLRGSDKFWNFSNIKGNLNATYIIPLGTKITTAIQSILNLVGDKKTPIFHSSLLDKTTPFTITEEASSNLSNILLKLASIYSMNIYYNTDGILVVEPDLDNNLKSSVWDYNQNEFEYLGGSLEYLWDEIYNSVKVIGTNINSVAVNYTSKNNSLLSPTSIPNLGYERTYLHQSDALDTEIKCQDLSIYILKQKMKDQSQISINSIPMYHISNSESDIITLSDTNLRLNEERFLITSATLPLSIGGQMQLNCCKEKELILS